MHLKEVLGLSLEVLIALIGVVGNILVVIVIHHLGKKKRPGDCYLQSLAIADIGTLLITSPLVIIRMEMPVNWPFGEFACLYVYPVAEIFYGASVWSIVVIAANRYHQMFYLKIFSRTRPSLQRAKTIAALVWVLSFIILCFPLYFVVDYRELLNGGQFCGSGQVDTFLRDSIYNLSDSVDLCHTSCYHIVYLRRDISRVETEH